MSVAIVWAVTAFLALVFLVWVFHKPLYKFVDNLESLGPKRWARRFRPERAEDQGNLPPAPADVALAASVTVTATARATLSSSVPAVTTEGESLSTEVLLRGMDTPMILARDEAIRTDLARLENPADKEKLLIRLLASSYVVRDFAYMYSWIYGSQIRALAALNSVGDAGVTPEALKPFYDDAAASNPQAYASYSFEQWANFLKLGGLIRESTNGYAITEWGNEFLVHLARSRWLILKPL